MSVPASGDSRGPSTRPSSPALFLEEGGEGEMKVGFPKSRETWMGREGHWGNTEGQRDRPPSRAAASLGSPFRSPGSPWWANGHGGRPGVHLGTHGQWSMQPRRSPSQLPSDRSGLTGAPSPNLLPTPQEGTD